MRQPKQQRKDGDQATHRMTEIIRVKEILGDVLDLVINATSSAQLRKVLNTSAWQIKKAVLVEALELGNIDKANTLATQILNLTEVKEKKFSGNIGMDIHESIQVLMAEITDVPFEYLERRAKELRDTKLIGYSGTGADRGRNEAPESGEVLVVENGAVSEQS